MAGYEQPAEEKTLFLRTMPSDVDTPWKAAISSQPMLELFQHRIIPAAARTKSLMCYKSLQELRSQYKIKLSDINSLSHQVFQELRARLLERWIDITGMDMVLFTWLLPKKEARSSDWNDLLNMPMFVSNDTLVTMFNLKPSTASTSPPYNGKTIFYVRTFTLTFKKLFEITQYLLDGCGESLELAQHWLEVIHAVCGVEHIATARDIGRLEGCDTIIYVRYCGMTCYTSSWTRHRMDLTKDSNTTIGLFLRLCKSHYPEVLASAEVHDFIDAQIDFPMNLARQELANQREQALIALFGHNSLLNTAIGGYALRFRPHDKDDAEFVALRTSTLQWLRTNTQPPISRQHVNSYATKVQKYANDHPATTNTVRFPIDNVIRDLLRDQALSAVTIRERRTLIATIGSDIPETFFKDKKAFFEGGCHSAALVVDILNHLGCCELGYSTTMTKAVTSMLANQQFPFVDLFPWRGKNDDDLQAALGLLRSYLFDVCPYIVLTFSETVSNIAAGHFQDSLHSRKKSFLEHVGTPILSRYNGHIGHDHGSDCCIIIPSLHPGIVQRSGEKMGRVYTRILSKTMAIAWLAMYEAMKCETSLGDTSKFQICEAILRALENQTGSNTQFGKTFAQLKLKINIMRTEGTRLSAVVKTTYPAREAIMAKSDEMPTVSKLNETPRIRGPDKNPKMSYPDQTSIDPISDISARNSADSIGAASTRWQAGRDEAYKVLECDMTIGLPNSLARREQVCQLLVGSTAKMVRSSRTGSTNAALHDWACTLLEGVLYFFAATNVSEQVERIPNLISIFLPAECDGDSPAWKHDKVLSATAATDLAIWVTTDLIKRRMSIDEALCRIPAAFQFLLWERSPELAVKIRRIGQQQVSSEQKQCILYRHNGQNVLIRSNTHPLRRDNLLLRWKHAGEEYEIMDFQVPAGTAPLVPNERRTIHFVPGGLDFRDDNGRSMGLSAGCKVTLPLNVLQSQMSNNDLGRQFIQLWERETGLAVDDIFFPGAPVSSLSPTSVYPQSFFHGRSEPYRTEFAGSKAAKEADLRRTLPIQPGDAAWLVNKFVTEQYPDGGAIDLGDPTIFTTVDSVWPHLEIFLQNPLYQNHPQRRNLKAAVDLIRSPAGGKGVIVYFIVLMRVLRPPVTQKSTEKRIDGRKRSRIILTIGNSIPPNAITDAREPKSDRLTADQVTRKNSDVEIENDDDEDEEEVQRKTLALKRRSAYKTKQSPKRISRGEVDRE